MRREGGGGLRLWSCWSGEGTLILGPLTCTRYI